MNAEDTDAAADEPRHPIKVAARRSGLTADLLRAWERRYSTIAPRRSDRGRRLYSDADIDHLRLIRVALAGGRRIGDLRALTSGELARLVAADRPAADLLGPATERPSPQAVAGAAPGATVDDCVAAAQSLDPRRLRALLEQARARLPMTEFVESFAMPLMRRLGELWRAGTVTPAQEHLASGVMIQLLRETGEALQPLVGRGHLVVATPSGQRHEIGAMFAVVGAALHGWRVTYLGADLPVVDIASSVRQLGADAVAISVTVETEDLPAQVAGLRASLAGVPLLVGGRAGGVADSTPVDPAVTRVDDLEAFAVALSALRPASTTTGPRP